MAFKNNGVNNDVKGDMQIKFFLQVRETIKNFLARNPFFSLSGVILATENSEIEKHLLFSNKRRRKLCKDAIKIARGII